MKTTTIAAVKVNIESAAVHLDRGVMGTGAGRCEVVAQSEYGAVVVNLPVAAYEQIDGLLRVGNMPVRLVLEVDGDPLAEQLAHHEAKARALRAEIAKRGAT